MGEVLGIGITHYTSLLEPPEGFANILKRRLKNPDTPEHLRDPKNWPAEMQDEWANEVERAHAHQAQLIAGFRKVRQAIDEFKPDAVIMWGDDQYEDFREDIIPAFHVYVTGDEPTTPYWLGQNNVWGEPLDKVFPFKVHKELAKHLAEELIERDMPIAYSYEHNHFDHGLTHSFGDALLYLDWDRKGWPYPIVPIEVNCYGKDVISSRRRDPEFQPFRLPGPSPQSCFRMGQLVRQILEERPERTIVMASSGWSHASLTAKHHRIWPDVLTDRQHVEDLRRGTHHRWAGMTNADIEDAGDHEFKNWICLAGAMEDRVAEVIDYAETWCFHSEKCFALFRP